MRHHIIVKFKDKSTLNELEHIKEIFSDCLKIDGISDIEYHTNCIDKDNRYDLMIVLIMDKGSLSLYDQCEAHKRWKEEYTEKIDKKAIFDCE